MTEPLELVAFSGSLRRESLNTALVRALQKAAPEGVTVTLESYRDVPLYDADLDVDGGPEPVKRLKDRIARAKGLVLVSPEYNYGIPGVLKNLLDWTSRPAFKSAWVGKPVLVAGASLGATGTARGQAQIKTTLLAVLAHPFPSPEILVGEAGKKLELDGTVKDEKLEAQLRRALEGFAAFVTKLG